MEPVYQSTKNLIHDVEFALGRLEKARNESEAQPLFRSTHQQLALIKQKYDELEFLASKESVNNRRAARFKVDQVKQDYSGLNAAINNIHAKLTNKWRVAAEREELLTQRIRPTETTLTFDDTELLVNDSMKNSHRAIDDLISQGQAVLGNIREQGMNLKGVRRKVLDVGQTLGLSGTTLRMIEKRLDEDWLIFCVGCVSTLVFMYCFYRYWKG
uniref:Golgi SNAP receptor complex member 2 n=1 Tax=Panagrellus redivivus TaxID=6233 RepID=A0A7E4ZRZ3_PANRE